MQAFDGFLAIWPGLAPKGGIPPEWPIIDVGMQNNGFAGWQLILKIIVPFRCRPGIIGKWQTRMTWVAGLLGQYSLESQG
jgi:hypothetical protein